MLWINISIFKSPNNQSEPFNIISILKCTCRSKFDIKKKNTIFKICTKSLDPKILDHSKIVISTNIKNSKKNSKKNVKFNLQVQFHIKIMLNGSNRLFEL